MNAREALGRLRTLRVPAATISDAVPEPINPSRCQRITVSGSTIARASLQHFHASA